MSGYGLWMAKCTTCDLQGPAARDENDENAQEWCDQHNAETSWEHKAMIVAGSDI